MTTTTIDDNLLAAAAKAAAAAEVNSLRAEIQTLANKQTIKPEDMTSLDQKVTTAVDAWNSGQKLLNEKIAQLTSDSAETTKKLMELASKAIQPPPIAGLQGAEAELNKLLTDAGFVTHLSGGRSGMSAKAKMPSLLSGKGMRLLSASAEAVDTGQLGGLIAPVYDTSFRPRPIPAKPFASYCRRQPIAGTQLIYAREDEDSAYSGIRTTNVQQEHNDHTVLTLTDVTGIVAHGLILISHGGVLYPTIVTSVDTNTKIVTVDWTYGHQIEAADVVVLPEFGGIAEGALKPATGFKTSPITANLEMLPITALVTRQADVLTDIRSVLGTRMPEMLDRNLSFLLLMGSTVIPGLLTTSGAQTQSWGHSDFMETDDSRADAVLRAWARCLTPGPYRAWMDRQAFISILLAKGAAEKGYLMSSFGPLSLSFASDGNSARLSMLDVSFDDTLRRPLSASWATMTRNCVVIDHAAANAVLYNPSMTEMAVGTSGDDFDRNQFRLRYEEMVGQRIDYFEAYCCTEFDHAPGA